MEHEILKYIELNIPLIKGRMYPVFTVQLDGVSVAYKFTPLSGGHVKQSQMELKILNKDYDTCKDMEIQIMKLLDMEEDAPYVVFGKTRFYSALAGGGVLFNDGCQMWEDTLYFIIDWRNEKWQ